MATRKQFIEEVSKHGATFEEVDTIDGKTIIVDAPEGKAWASEDDETTCLCGHYVIGWPIAEIYDELIERMKDGLQEAATVE